MHAALEGFLHMFVCLFVSLGISLECIKVCEFRRCMKYSKFAKQYGKLQLFYKSIQPKYYKTFAAVGQIG